MSTAEEPYRMLFERNPTPMWVYDVRTLEFLAVNDAAVACYRYSREEFLVRTLCDVWPTEDVPHLLSRLRVLQPGFRAPTVHRNRRRDGALIDVEIASHAITFEGRAARLVVVHEVTDRTRAEAALAEAETQYRSLVESLPGIVYVADPQPPYETIYVSPAIETLLGYTLDEWLANPDSWTRCLHPDDRARVLGQTKAAQLTGRHNVYEYRMIARDGSVRWFHDQGRFVRNAAGRPTLWQGVMIEITERKQAEEALRQSEERLRQSQKMEAVGQLAGGVAHDFNNLLTIISCHTQLLLESITSDSPEHEHVSEIRGAASRASELTRQLLAFSRKQLLKPQVLDLGAVVTNLEPMLRRLIGEDVHIAMVRAPAPCNIMADRGQIEQVLVNLAVNARDAMPQGGVLTIEITPVQIDAGQVAAPPLPPGAYVKLVVSDTGCGMTSDVQARIFEPFFTTKEPGRGTGLGLPTVYGIIKQSNGHIGVRSDAGLGTTFTIHLPLAAGEATRAAPAAKPAVSLRGTETMLLVEDEEAVRTLARRVLEREGYSVLEARHGAHALQLALEPGCHIDLVVTDVVMPVMSGRELTEALAPTHPDLRVLYISGYTDDEIIRRGLLDPSMAFLQKPFTATDLLRAVRGALDEVKIRACPPETPASGSAPPSPSGSSNRR
ncbi:MAG TPA: PAS domain S-box protein [Gemmatimonadaceae bacterium]|nr:PAS domain S-box protein [Gemmatimonadaceae bacterium]